jgi:putative transposase
MTEYQSLSHTRWDCKYHVVFIPKRRRKAIYGALRKNLGEIFRELAQQRECKVVEGHLMIDHPSSTVRDQFSHFSRSRVYINQALTSFFWPIFQNSCNGTFS